MDADNHAYDAAGNLAIISGRTNYPALGTALPPYNFATINASRVLANEHGASMTNYFDARNRLVRVNTDNPDGTGTADVDYGYNAVGSQKTMRYRNGVTTEYSYNTRNQLTRMDTTGGASASFEYDDAAWPADRRLAYSGQRRGLIETIGGTTRRVGYAYDNLNRLTRESLHDQNWVQTGAVVYDGAPGYGDASGFDPVGNRRARTTSGTFQGVVADASYADLDDNDEYDLENRLVRRKCPSPSYVNGKRWIEFRYDGDGNRVSKTLKDWHFGANPEADPPDATAVIQYLVDDRNLTGYAQVLEERDQAGSTVVRYVYGLDLVSQTRDTRPPGSPDPVWTTHYYGYDGLGSVRYLTDGTLASASYGEITDTYTYDAFGIQIASAEAIANNYRYTGEQWDPDLGMYFLRARYYNPQVGRFWTQDDGEHGEQEDPQSLHLYVYCADNPVNLTDPSGNEYELGGLMSVMSIGTVLFAQVSPASAQGKAAAQQVAGTRGRPSSATFWANYPDYSISQQDVWRIFIAGNLGRWGDKPTPDHPTGQSTCATRVSHGLNYTGLQSPRPPVRDGGETSSVNGIKEDLAMINITSLARSP